MSLVALTWAFDQYLPPAEKIVLLALADYADDTGRCWPSQETLTRKTSLSIRTIRNHIRDLEILDLVVTEERRREDGGRLSNMYVLALPPRQNLPVPPADSDRAPRQTVAGIGEPSEEPSEEATPPTPSEVAAFEALWTAWPKKVARLEALRAWNRLSMRQKNEAIPQLVAHANAHRQHTPPQFQPRLSVMIRDQRWDEPLAQSRDTGNRRPEADPYAGIVVPPPGRILSHYDDHGQPVWRDV